MLNKVNIIIPAKNEDKTIITTLKDLKEKIKVPYQIIVVNDKSTDKTELIVKKYSVKNRNVRLVNNTTKISSFGNALKIGFSKTKSGPVVFVMADLCDNPKTINLMYKKISEGWDIVCGSRYTKNGKKIGGPKLQGFLSNVINFSLYHILRLPTSDTSNAFKMYRHETLKNIKFNNKSGVEASMELLAQAYFGGAKIIDVPTTWIGRTAGQSKFKIVQRTPRYWKIYYWILKNRIRKIVNSKLEKFYA